MHYFVINRKSIAICELFRRPFLWGSKILPKLSKIITFS